MNEESPTTMFCECVDGPCAGQIEQVGIREIFVEVRHPFDRMKPFERYEVVNGEGGVKELRWVPRGPRARR